MALSSGCHLQEQVYLITTMETTPQKVTVTLLWVIVRALLVSKYGSGPSFNVFDYFMFYHLTGQNSKTFGIVIQHLIKYQSLAQMLGQVI